MPTLAPLAAADDDDVDKDTAVPSTILQQRAARSRAAPIDPRTELANLPHNKDGVFGSSADTPAYRDVAHASSTVLSEDQPVLVQIKATVPVRGKCAFAVWHPMAAPLKALKLQIVAQEGLPRQQLTLHLDSSAPLDEAKSLLDLGFRIPPLLSLRGFDFDITVRCVGVNMTLGIPWRVHMTTTDLMREVHRRFRPRDMRLVRFSIDPPPSGAQQDDPPPAADRRYLHTSNCCRYRATAGVDEGATLRELGLAADDSDPVTVRLHRTKEGHPLVFELNNGVTGRTSAGDILATLADLEARGELDAALVECTAEALALVASECPFDDSDEEVSPGGVQRLFFRGATPHPVFSLNPTAEECDAALSPHFVAIDEDFTVRHLTDEGVMPGAVLLLEQYNPHTRTWSGETEALLHAELQQQSATPGKISWASAGGGAGRIGPQVDLLTVRTDRGAVLRVPVSPMSTIDTVMHRVWCVTGDLPMFTVLQTDAGRLLLPHETIASAELFPQATIHSVRRPRPWLGESVQLPPPPLGDLTRGLREPDVVVGARPIC